MTTPQTTPEPAIAAMKAILFSGRLVDTAMIIDLYRAAHETAPAEKAMQDLSDLNNELGLGFSATQRVTAAPQEGWKITEEMHIAAVKVLHRAHGVDGLPQRMLDAMVAAAPVAPRFQQTYCQRCGSQCGPGDDGPIDCGGHAKVAETCDKCKNPTHCSLYRYCGHFGRRFSTRPPLSPPDTGNVGADLNWREVAVWWEQGAKDWQDLKEIIPRMFNRAALPPPGRGMVPMSVDWEAVGRILEAHHATQGQFIPGTSNWGAAIWKAARGITAAAATPLGNGEGDKP